MARRLEKTLADYVVIALTPALIMLLVGSLVFFLLEVGYQGHFEERMQWILFWFVFGSVLISRIGIEQGSAQSTFYGMGLAIATGLVILRYMDQVPIALGLLAVVWWCTAKLTWDCTLIDDSVDASGEGLLSVAGLDDRRSKNRPENANAQHDEAALSDAEILAEPAETERQRKNERPHAPGLWVVYFSLAALPLFGLGQLMIPASNLAGRRYAFLLLLTYVAAGLGLLLTTSFLGLRRYLRQRKLRMPASMAASWIVFGVVLILLILGASFLLPRPEATYSLTAMIDRLSSKDQDASQRAMLRDDAGRGDGQQIGRRADAGNGHEEGEGGTPDPEQDGDDGGASDQDQGESAEGGEQGDPGSQGDQSQAGSQGAQNAAGERGSRQRRGQSQGSTKSSGDPDRQASEEVADQQRRRNAQASESAPPSHAQTPTQFLQSLVPLLKWIVYGLLAVVVLYFLVRHWSDVVRGLVQFWQAILRLFGFRFPTRLEREAEEVAATLKNLTPPPFAAFDNPFTSGRADSQSPAAVLVYIFQALESWAYERGRRRPGDQTPTEFATILGQVYPRMEEPLGRLARAYASLAYAGRAPSRADVAQLEPLWREMADYDFRGASAVAANA